MNIRQEIMDLAEKLEKEMQDQEKICKEYNGKDLRIGKIDVEFKYMQAKEFVWYMDAKGNELKEPAYPSDVSIRFSLK